MLMINILHDQLECLGRGVFGKQNVDGYTGSFLRKRKNFPTPKFSAIKNKDIQVGLGMDLSFDGRPERNCLHTKAPQSLDHGFSGLTAQAKPCRDSLFDSADQTHLNSPLSDPPALAGGVCWACR